MTRHATPAFGRQNGTPSNGATSAKSDGASSRASNGAGAYKAAGIDYDVLDARKRRALDCALSTSPLIGKRGARVIDESRGESAVLFEVAGMTIGFVLETLGTKSVIARQVYEELGSEHDHFHDVAYDTVAAAVNDLCTVGALPLMVNAYFATGTADWYGDEQRAESLLEGWRSACVHANCAWGGGESPALPGLVESDEIELAASTVGIVPSDQRPILGNELAPGDEIVLARSTGLHANGASLARAIARGLEDGYATTLPSGTTYGDALLAATTIYVPLVEQLLERDHPITYMSHITGHGFLKLMRSQKELTYRITELPLVPEVLSFLVEQADMDSRTAYSTLNMGAGLAIYCKPGSGAAVVETARSVGVDARVSGIVEPGPRQVILDELDVAYGADELQLAPGARSRRTRS